MHRYRHLLVPLLRFHVIESIWLVAKYKNFQRKNSNHSTLLKLITEASKMLTNRLKISRTDNSFANENQIINNLLEEIDLKNQYLVDIGAADGIRQSSTLKLPSEKGWKGSLIEVNPTSFSRLSFLYNETNDVNLCKTKVQPDQVVNLLSGLKVPNDFDFLNLDIDSYDLAVLREVIRGEFRPALISMEINEIFPPNIHFEVLFNSEHVWNEDHFLGCSIRAAFDFLSAHGYVLMCIEYNNAFFVDKARLKYPIEGQDPTEAYQSGYRDRQERFDFFPWNGAAEISVEWSVDEVRQHVDKIFMVNKDKYILRIAQKNEI